VNRKILISIRVHGLALERKGLGEVEMIERHQPRRPTDDREELPNSLSASGLQKAAQSRSFQNTGHERLASA